MSDDIEEFLRRAAARRQQRQAQGAGPPKPQRAPQSRPPQRPVHQPPPDIQIVEPEVIEAETVHESVANQVQQYFGSANLISGDEVDQADEQMETHLHQVFDHRVGQLRDTSVGVKEPAEPQLDRSAPGAEKGKAKGKGANFIAEMLRSPKSLRQAIVVSEILRRPSDDL